MADPSGNIGKNSYISYDVYLKMRRSVHYYNLGLKQQATGIDPGLAAQYYFMALGLNPFDVDAKTAIEYLRTNVAAFTEDECTQAKAKANIELKKCGFCRR